MIVMIVFVLYIIGELNCYTIYSKWIKATGFDIAKKKEKKKAKKKRNGCFRSIFAYECICSFTVSFLKMKGEIIDPHSIFRFKSHSLFLFQLDNKRATKERKKKEN